MTAETVDGTRRTSPAREPALADDGDLASVASGLCGRLVAATPVAAVALLDVREDVVGRVLASRGPALPVPHLSGAALRRRADEGAWAVAHATGQVTTYVPVPFRGQVRALLVTRVEASDHDAAVRKAETGRAAWEAAALAVAAPLGRLLLDRDAHERRVRQVEQAIVHRHFHPVFQPVVELAEGTAQGYEALTRFGDGRTPQEWFAQAGEVGRRVELELATARAALLRGGTGEQWLGINLSVATLRDAALLDVVAMARRPLVVEILDHEALAEPGAVRAAVAALPGRVSLAVNHSSVGLASLESGALLCPAFGKIDMALVRGIDRDSLRRSLVTGLVNVATDAGIALIAEGIETRSERDVLVELGITLGQGWLFGQPG